MPNRIIKESICTSDSLSNLNWFEQAVFFRLIVLADDFGAYFANPKIIKGRGFTMNDVSEKQVASALDSIEREGMITRYTVSGKPYLQLTSWKEHQQIRAKKSKFPQMSDADEICNQLISDDISGNQSQANAPVIQYNTNQSESNPNPNPIGADKKTASRFVPPTIDEVTSYCSERNNGIDPQNWYDYYVSNGWMVGKNHMKDWKASVRTWERNGYHNSGRGNSTSGIPKHGEEELPF